MALILARTSFVLVLMLTASLSLWKSSDLHHTAYLQMETYLGGSSTLHFTFSLWIGFLSVFTFPSLVSSNKTDFFGIRLLLLLLAIVSMEEMSQLFIPNRSFSFDDLSTNWIGVISGYFSAKLIRFIRTRSF
ncbi:MULTISPECIES: VanZ family protein [Vibrio]|jgi:glycopeptide antibiotics resistance protein|uniref:VanZ family protein n=1 Tax=Vibrio TaxID=662 RepID=UPI0006A575DB|nr:MULTISPECIES: VanZ family protein [Vibrio]EGQ9097782.1 VanZ family protein [Vibrio alginolyticus]EGQ9231973.1 VanZ family protein [Vibrio alginolyticus]EGR0712354.1 VanZ family protein [Vibrio alginolyticus]EKY4877014.1 VanZ family protein [Vibrio alginolyticus]KOF31770.1 antibiotic resistance protein VanZ [Vibrio alginolyticus]